MSRALVDSNIQPDVGSFNLRFSLSLECQMSNHVSYESLKIKLCRISASLMMSGKQKKAFGPSSEKLV